MLYHNLQGRVGGAVLVDVGLALCRADAVVVVTDDDLAVPAEPVVMKGRAAGSFARPVADCVVS